MRKVKILWTCCDACRQEHRTPLAARAHYMWLNSFPRRVLFGDNEERVFDICDYRSVYMGERPLMWRLKWRLVYRTPYIKLCIWTQDWDYRFRMRYIDRWLKVSKQKPYWEEA